VIPDAPHPAWKLAVIAAWGASVASVLVMILGGMLIMVVSPVVFAMGIGLIAPTTREALREPTCPRCGRTLADVRAVRGRPAAAEVRPHAAA
jgi:hypothetical protein